MLSEIRALTGLAIPLVLSQLGLMTMVLVDSYMVGKLGSTQLAGMGLGNTILVTLGTLLAGLVFGLDGLFSREYSRGGKEAVAPWLAGATILSLGASLFCIAGIYLGSPWIAATGIAPDVADVTASYIQAISWALPAGVLFLLCRQFLAAAGVVKGFTWMMIVANFVNFALNWLLIPKFQATGAGISTAFTRFVMVALMLPDCLRLLRGVSFRPRLRELWGIGGPLSLQMMLRAGVFSLLGVWVGRMGVIPLAAHSIVLVIANTLNMIAIGLSTAVAIRVGKALGAGDEEGARRATIAGLLLGGGTMLILSLVLWVIRGPIAAPFSEDPNVLELAKAVLLWVVLFQIMDTLQYVVAGALRAYHEYRSVLIGTILGMWGIGLWVSHVSSKVSGLSGIWAGVFVGLVVLFGITGITLWRISSLRAPAVAPSRSH